MRPGPLIKRGSASGRTRTRRPDQDGAAQTQRFKRHSRPEQNREPRVPRTPRTYYHVARNPHRGARYNLFADTAGRFFVGLPTKCSPDATTDKEHAVQLTGAQALV